MLCPPPSPQWAATQAAGEPLELDELVHVVIQEAEGPVGEEVGVLPAGPGREQAVEAGELLGVDAVLLSVRPAGVVALWHRTPALPVAPDQMFPLGEMGDTSGCCGVQQQRAQAAEKGIHIKLCCNMLEIRSVQGVIVIPTPFLCEKANLSSEQAATLTISNG